MNALKLLEPNIKTHRFDNDYYTPCSLFEVIDEYNRHHVVTSLIIEDKLSITSRNHPDIDLSDVLLPPDINIITYTSKTINIPMNKMPQVVMNINEFHKFLSSLVDYNLRIDLYCSVPALPLIYLNNNLKEPEKPNNKQVLIVEYVVVAFGNERHIALANEDGISNTDYVNSLRELRHKHEQAVFDRAFGEVMIGNNRNNQYDVEMNRYDYHSYLGDFCRPLRPMYTANGASTYRTYIKEYMFKSTHYPNGIIVYIKVTAPEGNVHDAFKYREQTLLRIVYTYNYFNDYSGEDKLTLVSNNYSEKYEHYTRVAGRFVVYTNGVSVLTLENMLENDDFEYEIMFDSCHTSHLIPHGNIAFI